MKASKIKKKKTFFKKLFLKLSRLLGYEVMDQGDLSLLSTEGKEERNSLSQIGKSSLTLPMGTCLLYTSPSPRDKRQSRMPSSA